MISKKVCNSKVAQCKENRNLVDLVNTTLYVSQKLQHYGKDDAEVNGLRKTLSNSISIFKEELIALNRRSTVKLYTWEEAKATVQEEIAQFEESNDLF